MFRGQRRLRPRTDSGRQRPAQRRPPRCASRGQGREPWPSRPRAQHGRYRPNRVSPAPLLGNSCIDRQNAIAEARIHLGKPCPERFGPLEVVTARLLHSLADFALHRRTGPQIVFGDPAPPRRDVLNATAPLRTLEMMFVAIRKLAERHARISVDVRDRSPRAALLPAASRASWCMARQISRKSCCASRARVQDRQVPWQLAALAQRLPSGPGLRHARSPAACGGCAVG